MNAQTYRLRLSKKWRIYFVFYVSLLESYYKNVNATKSKNIILIDENEKYEIETILDNKIKWKKFYYFVKWKNYAFCENSWIFQFWLVKAQSLLKKYYKRRKSEIALSKTKKSRLRVKKSDAQRDEEDFFENENQWFTR